MKCPYCGSDRVNDRNCCDHDNQLCANCGRLFDKDTVVSNSPVPERRTPPERKS
jgi:transcription initiation factor TFIIIB Brf1 subunit/transcription initiation factor TFIIB